MVEFDVSSGSTHESIVGDRQAAIERLKWTFEDESSAVFDFLQREPTMRQTPDRCWLNRTLRVDARPHVLAEAAADPAIRSIDVPRQLSLDLEQTASATGVRAWQRALGLTGEDVNIAVIDGEVDAAHPAFGGRAVAAGNFTSEAWGRPHPHGTAVAAVAAAAEGDGGVAHRAAIQSYKVFASEPDRHPRSTDFEAALAIQQAVEDGADILNCSWGTGPVGTTLSREAVACNTAWDLGLLVVKSAGNGGRGGLTMPAEAAGVVVVGASDVHGTAVAEYSGYGAIADGSTRPHLLAPGGTERAPLTVLGSSQFGTSFVAAYVSGVAALLLERDQDLRSNPGAVRRALLDLCCPLTGVRADVQGAGVLRV